MMNKLIDQLIKQATTIEVISGRGFDETQYTERFDKQKFAELIIEQCRLAVLEVPCYYKDYRSQIEEAVINDCARAVLDRFGIKS